MDFIVLTEKLEQYKNEGQEIVNVGNKQSNLTKGSKFWAELGKEDETYYWVNAMSLMGHKIPLAHAYKKTDVEKVKE